MNKDRAVIPAGEQVFVRDNGNNGFEMQGRYCCLLFLIANSLLHIGKETRQIWLLRMAEEIIDQIGHHHH